MDYLPDQIPIDPSLQQQYGGYNNLYAPPQNQMTPDVIKYRLESEDLMTQLEHDLKGEHFIDNKWVGGYGKWLNDEGLSIARSLAARYANRGCYLGKLHAEQIDFKCCKLKKELAQLFLKKYRLYGIDRAKRSLLIMKITDTVHLSLTRSEEGHESNQISKTAHTDHVIHENKDQGKEDKGFLGWMQFPKFKRES